MSRRSRDLLLLYGLALLINGAVALLVSVPGYVDAAYYFNGGLAIAEGRGLVDPYIWNYVGAPDTLPAPAFAYWQPLPSFLAALGILIFGQGAAFGSAQAIYVLAGSALPLITYTVAEQIGQRRHALIAGLLTVFSGYYVVFWSLPESFTPFALSGSVALLLIGAGRRSGQWWVWLAAGMCSGLAHLTRADGVLVAVIAVLVALLPGNGDRENKNLSGARRGAPLHRRLLFALLVAAGYLVVMGPWFARNLAVFGSVQAPGGLSTLWLVDYNDLFNYPPDLSAQRFLAAGWMTILRTRWQALTGNLATFIGVHNLVFLTPFTLIGLWRRWRSDWLLQVTLYGLALFGAMTFVFALPGVRGGWLHSGTALEPSVLAVATVGLDDAIRWVARHRQGWRAEPAWRVFSAGSVGLAAAISVFVVLTRVVGLPDLTTIDWNSTVYDEIGAALDEVGAPPGAMVMSNNPPGFYTHTGHGGVPIPNGDETTLLRAAEHYGITFLVIDHNVPDGLTDFYWHGPASPPFVRIGVFGNEAAPTYLYRIEPGN